MALPPPSMYNKKYRRAALSQRERIRARRLSILKHNPDIGCPSEGQGEWPITETDDSSVQPQHSHGEYAGLTIVERSRGKLSGLIAQY